MHHSHLINSNFQAIPVGPITAQVPRIPKLKRPLHLPRVGQRDALRAARFARRANKLR